MRIEILVENEDPQIFPLNQPKITIGSQENCDILLGNGVVSRRHLVILKEEDNYYVVDQGSTNGSFINEERLVPGRKVEFTSFFPVRLGADVLITLLSDEDAQELGYFESSAPKVNPLPKTQNDNSDATRTISLKELQSAKTESLVKKRQETLVKRKTQVTKKAPTVKSSDQSRMNMVKVICVVILAGAAYYNFYVMDEVVTEVVPPPVVQERVEAKPLPPKFTLVDQVDVPSKAKLDDIQTKAQCETDVEKEFCGKLTPDTSAVQILSMIYVFSNIRPFYDKAVALGTVTPAKSKAIENDLLFAAAIMFFYENFPKQLDFTKYKDLNFTFALNAFHEEPEKTGHIVISITADSLQKLISVIQPFHIDMMKKVGVESVLFTKEYFRVEFLPAAAPNTVSAVP